MPDLACQTNTDVPIGNVPSIFPQGVKRKRERPAMGLSEEEKKKKRLEQARNRWKKQGGKEKQVKIEQAVMPDCAMDDRGQAMMEQIVVQPYRGIAIALKPIAVEAAENDTGVPELSEPMQPGKVLSQTN